MREATVLSSSKMYDGMKSGALDMIMTGVTSVDMRNSSGSGYHHTNGARRAEFVVIVNERRPQPAR